jgi:Rieske 2Fe-2S family protein
MLPAEAYTSPDVLAWERRHFFAATWTCIGRLDEHREHGTTQRGVLVGDVPVLVTIEGSRVRAFADTCRHRGHELLGSGVTAVRASIVCPYHAWSYRLDGSLLGAPGFRAQEAFLPDEYGLVPLPVQNWHAWLFVNATGTGPAFASHIGDPGGPADLEALVAPYGPERLVRCASQTYELAANWKVVCENYHECYHCPLIHPELCRVSPPTSGDNYPPAAAWVGGRMELRDDAETMSLSGRGSGVPIAGAPPREVRYLGVLPNLLLSLHPDYVMTHLLRPLSPNRTWIECSWYFPPEAASRAGFDPAYAVEFWDLTNRQDWSACESVQRGLSSPHFVPGPLAPNEDAVYRFVSTIARGYCGVPLHER